MLCILDHRKVRKPLPWKEVLVEIGFGRGEYILRLARENQDKHIVGFELSGIAVERLLKKVRKLGAKNVHCVRLDAFWGLQLLFSDSSLEGIFINYPDPWFKKRDVRKRITRREKLYLFHRKLREGGTVEIRTDHFPFVEFTLGEVKAVGGFQAEWERVETDKPLTKYEEKWLREGRELYRITLRKKGVIGKIDIPFIREVLELFPRKVYACSFVPEQLQGRTIKMSEDVYVRFSRVFKGEDTYLLESLLSEHGFVQRFFVEVRKKGEEWTVDVSPHSEVIRTEKLRDVLELVAEEAFIPLSR